MLLWFEPTKTDYKPVTKSIPKAKPKAKKRKSKRGRDWNASERICKQLTRLMLVAEKLRTAGELALADLESMDPDTCSRTYRRDLAVLTRMDWCEPAETAAGKTVWRWTKDV